MGILDDAIREHLELKRQHGAGSDDLERLENEAFGPATRPGDPEFADPDAEGAAAAAPAAVEETGPETGRLDWLTEGKTTVAPEVSPSSAEEPRIEHADRDDTADHPAPEPPSEEGPAVEASVSQPPATEEPGSAEPPEAPEREIFDAQEIDFGDLDIDLDDPDEDDSSSAGPPAPVPPSADEDEDGDLELSLDDDRAPAEEAATAVQPSTEPAVDDDAEDGDGEEPGDEEPREDLLEETPDFLQDAPEGDRLWFEQGAPKDFDFEDED